MVMRGRVVSISNGVAKVCIIKERTVCGMCSACPKKTGTNESVDVEAIKGTRVGQEVVIRNNRNWLSRHKTMCALVAFISGVMITEALSVIVPFGAHRKEFDLFGGGVFTIIVAIVSWIFRPRYLLRIELIKGEKA